MQRVVIKVGSHVLTEDGGIARKRMAALVRLIADLIKQDREVILVSSGAVAAGYTRLALDQDSVANRQALAAIGQPLLLSMYQELFSVHGIVCAQVLLSADVFDSRKATRHAKAAVDALLDNRVVPIINENDTVSIDELVFGDNDRLSAHVTHYFDAELLVILSDIDAYYDKDPNRHDDAQRQPVIDTITSEQLQAEHTPNDPFATGGIVTKLQAARFLMDRGRVMLLASGFDLQVARRFLVDGVHEGGTLFRQGI